MMRVRETLAKRPWRLLAAPAGFAAPIPRLGGGSTLADWQVMGAHRQDADAGGGAGEAGRAAGLVGEAAGVLAVARVDVGDRLFERRVRHMQAAVLGGTQGHDLHDGDGDVGAGRSRLVAPAALRVLAL